ncbi:Linear gramicidin dehydrogenase LgrE [Streptomyces sp. RB5]|uniref:Linear gramicidin dehydrogenase LgrE n=1 Tax=Streptomyces smaragdinus TaxID=2585196 RepID=A0A7K0CDU4_9ACTN|nr:thioesterase domain-containing protein [Streptomyces smaragdinus]MQY11649.1 Linear gramicidin dehydrogenase LgrE [Streptomyces smaragdinus]
MSDYLAAGGRPDTALNLFCFHHAGSGALSFARWPTRFPDGVSVLPVRLPGRETRIREPRITDARRLIGELDRELGPLLEAPYAFYGHSLGALVAYRLAEHRQQRGAPGPELVALGACAAPHLPTPALEEPPTVSDERLLAVLSRYGTLPSYLYDRPRWLSSVLSLTRDDLALARDLRTGAGRPLSCPVVAFSGVDDTVATAAAVAEWRRYTTGSFEAREVAGGHYFVRDETLPRMLAGLLDRRPHTTAAGHGG